MINIDNFNSSIFAVMGETALIAKSGGGVLSVVGIFEQVLNTNVIGYVSHADSSFTLTVRWGDISSYKKSDYKSITIRDDKYQIIEVERDLINNLAIMKLRRFT